MASVQCKNCKYGIHYHGEPSDIEYVMIEFQDWTKIISARFDSGNKIFDAKTGYPKLYRTDTISEDFPDAIRKFWKCPKCGTLIFFDKKGLVTAEYMPKSDCSIDVMDKEWTGICFDDYQWDELTESALSDEQLSERPKLFYEIFVSDNELALKQGFNGKITRYSRIM